MVSTDCILAERHGKELSKRDSLTPLANYITPTTPFCPAKTQLIPHSNSTPLSNRPGDGQNQSLALSPKVHYPSNAGPGELDMHDASSPEVSSSSGAYFSTILSQSVSSDENDIDSPPTLQRHGRHARTQSNHLSRLSLGSKARREQSERPT